MPEIDDLRNALAALATQFEDVVGKLAGYSGATKNSTTATVSNEKAINDLANMYGRYQKALADAVTKHKDMIKQMKESKVSLSELNQKYVENINKLIELRREEKEEEAIKKRINDIIEKQTRTLGEHITALKNQKDSIGGVMSIAMGYGKVFGAQELGLQKLKDTVIKYNQSLFDLRRIQKTIGSGTGDLNVALKTAEQTTAMSRNQTLSFATAMSKLYVGVKPTTTEFVKLASAIQREFGPSMEATEEVARDLMDIQNKWPSLYDNILSAHEKMAKGITGGNENMINSAKSLASSNLLQMIAMGASRSQIEKVMRLQNAQGDGQDEIAKLNTETAKAAQSAEDAVLAVGKAAEGAMTVAAMATKKFYDGMKMIPGITATVITAMGLLDIAANTHLISLMGLIKAQLQFNNAKMIGSSIPSSSVASSAISSGAGSAAGAASAAGTLVNSGGSIGTSVAGFVLIGEGLGALNATQDKAVRDANEQALMEQNLLMNLITGVFKSGETITTAIYASKGAKDAVGAEARSKSDFGEMQSDYIENSKKGSAKFAELWSKSGGDILTESEQKKIDTTRIDDTNNIQRRGDTRVLNQSEKEQMAKDLLLERAKKIVKEIHVEDNATASKEKEIREIRSKSLGEIQKTVLGNMKAKEELGSQLQLQQKMNSSYNTQLDIAREMGTVDDKLLDNNYRAAEQVAQTARLQLKNISQLGAAAQSVLEDIGLADADKLEFKAKLTFKEGMSSAEVQKQINEVAKQLDPKLTVQIALQQEAVNKAHIAAPGGDAEKLAKDQLNKLLGTKNGLLSYGAIIADQETSSIQARVNAEKKLVGIAYEKMNVQEKFNSMIETNLNLERQVMEAGQFGLGASVQMMQKQVDLASERIKQLQQGDLEARNNLKTNRDIDSSLLDQVDSAQSFSEIQKITNDYIQSMGLKEDEAKRVQYDINAYAEKHLETSAKITQQQLKVYELTKEVREGYLSAIKSMAVGFGQFSKIIGGQTRGVTQLMNITKQATGSFETNTMALGGMVAKGSTDMGTKPSFAASITGGMSGTKTKEQMDKEAAWRNYYRAPGAPNNIIGTGQVDNAATSALKASGVSGGSPGNVSTNNIGRDLMNKIGPLSFPAAGTESLNPLTGVNLGRSAAGVSGSPAGTSSGIAPMASTSSNKDSMNMLLEQMTVLITAVRDNKSVHIS